MKKRSKKKTSKAYTLLEVLIAISILSILAIVLARVFTISMKASIALEKFSYDDKKIDIFISNIKNMLEKMYFFADVGGGYDDLKALKLSLECPLYIERSKGFFEGTSLLRFVVYDPQFFDNLYYGLVIVEIKIKTEKDKQAVYFSTIPLFLNSQMFIGTAKKFKDKEYLLLEDIDKFQVDVYINGQWQNEFACNIDEDEENEKEEQTEFPKILKITIEKKQEGIDKPSQYTYTIKLK